MFVLCKEGYLIPVLSPWKGHYRFTRQSFPKFKEKTCMWTLRIKTKLLRNHKNNKNDMLSFKSFSRSYDIYIYDTLFLKTNKIKVSLMTALRKENVFRLNIINLHPPFSGAPSYQYMPIRVLFYTIDQSALFAVCTQELSHNFPVSVRRLKFI